MIPRLFRLLVSLWLAVTWLLVTAGSEAAGPRVNVQRWKVRGGKVVAPSDRGTAILTLDPDLQKDVERLVKGSRAPEAAAVVIEIATGRILAWYSVNSLGRRDLVSQPYAPPASLFKVITAAALLERGHVPLNKRQCYVNGERDVRLRYLRRNGAGGARCSTFFTSIGYSRNMVVAGLAHRFLRPRDLRDMQRAFDIGGGLPIDVAVGHGWTAIPRGKEAFARTSAGFGKGTLTPLEAAYMMTVIARGGVRPPLRLLEGFVGADGKRRAAPPPRGKTGRAIKPSTARHLARMLRLTVREGTAARAFRDKRGRRYLGKLGGAGKTGTLARGKPNRLFSWYAGYAPTRSPKIAVAVMLGNHHKWWRKGNQVARDIFRAYFARRHVAGVSHPLRSVRRRATRSKSRRGRRTRRR